MTAQPRWRGERVAAVSFDSVPAFVRHRDVTVELPGVGAVHGRRVIRRQPRPWSTIPHQERSRPGAAASHHLTRALCQLLAIEPQDITVWASSREESFADVMARLGADQVVAASCVERYLGATVLPSSLLSNNHVIESTDRT